MINHNVKIVRNLATEKKTVALEKIIRLIFQKIKMIRNFFFMLVNLLVKKKRQMVYR